MSYLIETYFKMPLLSDGNSKIFSIEHILLSTIIICVLVVLLRTYKEKDGKSQRRLLLTLAVVIFSFEALRALYMAIYQGFDLKAISFTSCAQTTLYLPLAIYFNKRWMYDFVLAPAIIGGVGAMLYPIDVFNDYPVFHIIPVQSMITHGLFWFVITFLVITKKYQPRIKNVKYAMLGGCTIALIAAVMSYINDANYTLMGSAEGIPIIGLFPFPFHIPVIILIYFLIATVIFGIFEIIYLRNNIELENTFQN